MWSFPKDVLLLHSTYVPRIHQPPGTWDTALDHPKVHANTSTVLRSLLTNDPVSLPEIADWLPSADHIGLFRHLEDLKLIFSNAEFTGPTDNLAPPPPIIPPLRRRLTIMHTNTGFLKVMINAFGGVRFHFMDLSDVNGMQLLLDASADTQEVVRFYQTDPRGQSIYQRTA